MVEARVNSRSEARALNVQCARARRLAESKRKRATLAGGGQPAAGRRRQDLGELRREQAGDELGRHERHALGLHAVRAMCTEPGASASRTVSAGARSRRAPRVSCRSLKSSTHVVPRRAPACR